MLQLPGYIWQWKRNPPDSKRYYRALPMLIINGFILAVHFASWTWSIAHTSLAHSLLGVTSHPLVIVVAMWLYAGFRHCCRRFTNVPYPSWMESLGALIGFGGGAMMVIGVSEGDTKATIEGDMAAFLGAVAMAIYLAVGRVYRRHFATFLYAFPVTFASAVFSFLFSLIGENSRVDGLEAKYVVLRWSSSVLTFPFCSSAPYLDGSARGGGLDWLFS